MSCRTVPTCTWNPSVTLDRDDQDCLHPIESIVGKEAEMEARTWRHHLITFCDHIDWAGTVCHDLRDQPVLERTDHPFIPVVHHDDRRVLRVIIIHWDRLLITWHPNFIGIVWIVAIAIIPVPVALISVVSTSHWISYPGPARTEPDQRTKEQLFVLGSSIQYISPKWQLRDLKPKEQSVNITTEQLIHESLPFQTVD